MRVFFDKEQGYIASTKRGFSTKTDSPLWVNPGELVLQPRDWRDRSSDDNCSKFRAEGARDLESSLTSPDEAKR